MRTITDPTALRAYRSRYAAGAGATGALIIKAKRGDAIAWLWTDQEKRLRALAFFGRAMHPYSGRSGLQGCSYSFRTEAARAQWIGGLLERAAAAAKRTEERRAQVASQRANGHKLKVGSVLRCSWGYDQTNIDFYQVTALVGRTMVEVREIGQDRDESSGWMQGDCTPAPGHFTSPAKRYRVSPSGDSISVHSFASAYLIEPTAKIAGISVFQPSSWSATH